MKKLIAWLTAVAIVTGVSFAGAAGYRTYFQAETIVATNNLELMSSAAVTLTTANCGSTYMINDTDGGTTTLMAATDGCEVGFFVNAAIGTANHVIDSAEGDNIEGAMIVNSVAVDCAGEDQINIVNTAEGLNDYVKIASDGTSWYIMDSLGVAAGALTCTDPS
jgi:hypothetical protein